MHPRRAPDGMTPARIADARQAFRTLWGGHSVGLALYVHGFGQRAYMAGRMAPALLGPELARLAPIALSGAVASWALWYWHRRLYTELGTVAHRMLGLLMCGLALLALLVVGPYAAGIAVALGPVRLDTGGIVLMAGALSVFLCQAGLVLLQDKLMDYAPPSAPPPPAVENPKTK